MAPSVPENMGVKSGLVAGTVYAVPSSLDTTSLYSGVGVHQIQSSTGYMS